MIRLAVSPMPMGRTPGVLSRAMRRQASSGEMDFGSTSAVHILLAVEASELHRLVDAPLNEVHYLLQSCASRPDGPADPVVFSTAERIALASIDSKMTGCVSEGVEVRMQWALALCPVGCLLTSTSLTDGEPVVFGSDGSSRWRMPPLSPLDRRSRAALHLPANMRLANERASFSLALLELVLGRRCWMALPSRTRSFRLPSFHFFSLLSKQVMCSFVLEALCGFCSRRMGRIVADFRAIDSSADAEAKAWKR